jgi:hypothetical protein
MINNMFGPNVLMSADDYAALMFFVAFMNYMFEDKDSEKFWVEMRRQFISLAINTSAQMVGALREFPDFREEVEKK